MSERSKIFIINSVLSLSLFLTPAFAEKVAKPAASPSLESIQELVLKGGRPEAVRQLNQKILEVKKESERQPILDLLDRVSSLFYTDQGQKLYEAGVGTIWSQPLRAKSLLREALEKEPAQLLVLQALAIVQLIEKNCKEAKGDLQKISEDYPHSKMNQLLSWQADLCLGDAEPMLTEMPEILKKWTGLEKEFGEYLHQKALVTAGKRPQLKTVLEKLSDFPEVYALSIKAAQARSEKLNREELDKYLALCRNLNTNLRRKYMFEPHLCSELNEISALREAALE